MASWFGSISFVLFSALFGAVIGFGLAAMWRGFKDRKLKKEEKTLNHDGKNDSHDEKTP